MSDKRVVVIAGTTASGKTALGIAAAQDLHSEIISADSMQIYRGMDIGTAKASAAEQKAARHYMIDVAEPGESYSVARYVKEASLCCDRLLSEGKTPIIVGGTGLYIDSLLAGRDFGRQEENETLRRQLNEDYQKEGGEILLEKLRSFDPERAALLHPADRKRIIRAMEVYYLSGETITEHDRKTREIPPRYEAMVLIPGFRNRALLYERIDRRVIKMVQQGLFEEVEKLLESGISAETTAMQAIGYKEAMEAIQGLVSREEAIEKIQMASRRYAKRQLTWFSRRKDALRLYHDDPGGTEQLTKEALQEIRRWVYDDCR